jgi:hypothetical protein
MANANTVEISKLVKTKHITKVIADKPIIRANTEETETLSYQRRSEVTITFSHADIIYNPSVGNEWSVWIEANGRTYYLGDQFTVTQGTKIHLVAMDDDPSEDDIGRTAVTINSNIISFGRIEKSVFVKEYRGKGAGNTAEWEFTLDINSL